MSRYLLSSQCVFDIIKRRNLDAELWLEAADARGLYADDICISAVTPMTIQWQLEQALAYARAHPETTEYPVPVIKEFIDQANRFFEEFARHDRIIPMDHKIASKWGDLLDMKITFQDQDGRDYDVPSATKVEIATALIGRGDFPLVYVDYHQDGHASIPNLAVENPEDIVTK
ncbi:hypothetical protein [Hyphomonas pacifica]|uniref:Uncharacterized protein n=1 Tax=Hyphomonas pacifica TaxID=1280941 RepID=A0A062TX77_9PROT|nr:hypothetical protein [Hyphomonas pacifica]KCZ52631.1 hypothetical protein HY2_07770 [Hyphomonas pacifica]RAN32834.1 hypothetical protein HY3_13960 [Hyphomonas pacifica]